MWRGHSCLPCRDSSRHFFALAPERRSQVAAWAPKPASRRKYSGLTSLRRSLHWKAKDESRSLPRLAAEINSTIVKLHDPKSHCQTDSGALLLGGEVELKNFVPL